MSECGTEGSKRYTRYASLPVLRVKLNKMERFELIWQHMQNLLCRSSLLSRLWYFRLPYSYRSQLHYAFGSLLTWASGGASGFNARCCQFRQKHYFAKWHESRLDACSSRFTAARNLFWRNSGIDLTSAFDCPYNQETEWRAIARG